MLEKSRTARLDSLGIRQAGPPKLGALTKMPPRRGRPPATGAAANHILSIAHCALIGIRPSPMFFGARPDYVKLHVVIGTTEVQQTNYLNEIVIQADSHPQLGMHLSSADVPEGSKCLYLMNFALYLSDENTVKYFRVCVNGHSDAPRVSWGHG